MGSSVPERCSPRRATGPGPPAGLVRGSGGGEKMGDGLGRPKPARSPWEGGSTEPLSVPEFSRSGSACKRERCRFRDSTFSDEPGPRGFEPLTLRLRAACSTELSYGPATGRADPASTHKASLCSARRRFRAGRPFSWDRARPTTSVRVASVVLDVSPIDRTRRLRGPLRFPRFPTDRAPSRSVRERRGGCPRSTPTRSRGSAAPPPSVSAARARPRP